MTKRIIFTGGTGKAGRHAVPHLLAKGYSILNVDLKPLELPGVNTLIADLTDSGQAFNALTTHFGFDGYDDGAPPKAPDAVVHFAAIPRVMIEPDNMTFAANVTEHLQRDRGRHETGRAQGHRRLVRDDLWRLLRRG